MPTKKPTEYKNLDLKPPKNRTHYKDTVTAIKLVTEHGLPPKEALLLAKGKKTLCKQAVTAFRRKVAQHSLTRPSVVKLARDVITDVLSGTTRTVATEKVMRDGTVVVVNETVYPTDTNRLTAAAMVYDRVEPIVRQHINLTGELADFLPVDLSEYGGTQSSAPPQADGASDAEFYDL